MKKASCTLNRRDFIKASAAGLAAFSAGPFVFAGEKPANKTQVVLVKTNDRVLGVKTALGLLKMPSPKGKKVFIKPNFNTADIYPGSTHNDTLASLVREMKTRGASAITVGERSGPPPTQKVMEDKGIPALAKELGFDVINFENLPETEWVKFNPAGSHWPEGFSIPKSVKDAEYIAATCLLKTHQFGGVFTMSLKLAVGLTPKSLMRRLHRSPDMRKMIAEINLAYKPTFILMDGIEVFVDGGPMTGKKVQADVMVAGMDRIAVDAVGLAVLKELGSNDAIMSKKIFDQEQIQRAVELGLGVRSPDLIEIVTSDAASNAYAKKVKAILVQG